MIKFTPTERRILNLLSDARAHVVEELQSRCINDDLADVSAVRIHVCNLRKKLRPLGEDIIHQRLQGKSCYRHVRLLGSAVSGYR